LIAASLGISLAACASNNGVKSLDGAKAAFDPPPYAVKGKTSYDQRWIDGQIEAGVAAFNWPRPQPRPVELDAPKAATKPIAVPTPARKPSVFKRWWPK
jgi:hypothetical protein